MRAVEHNLHERSLLGQKRTNASRVSRLARRSGLNSSSRQWGESIGLGRWEKPARYAKKHRRWQKRLEGLLEVVFIFCESHAPLAKTRQNSSATCKKLVISVTN